MNLNEHGGNGEIGLTEAEATTIKSFIDLIPGCSDSLAAQLAAAEVIGRVGAPSRLEFEIARQRAAPLGDGVTLVARLSAHTPAGERCHVGVFAWQGWLHNVSVASEAPASFS